MRVCAFFKRWIQKNIALNQLQEGRCFAVSVFLDTRRSKAGLKNRETLSMFTRNSLQISSCFTRIMTRFLFLHFYCACVGRYMTLSVTDKQTLRQLPAIQGQNVRLNSPALQTASQCSDSFQLLMTKYASPPSPKSWPACSFPSAKLRIQPSQFNSADKHEFTASIQDRAAMTSRHTICSSRQTFYFSFSRHVVLLYSYECLVFRLLYS